MKIFRIAFISICVLALIGLTYGQDSPQTTVASKTAKFGTIAKTDADYAKAIDAHDFAAADKLLGQRGAFKGTVAKVFVPKSGGILILNFDKDYKSALTAVLKKSSFKDFPDMEQLVGEEVVISGEFSKFNGASQVELTGPLHVMVVK